MTAKLPGITEGDPRLIVRDREGQEEPASVTLRGRRPVAKVAVGLATLALLAGSLIWWVLPIDAAPPSRTVDRPANLRAEAPPLYVPPEPASARQSAAKSGQDPSIHEQDPSPQLVTVPPLATPDYASPEPAMPAPTLLPSPRAAAGSVLVFDESAAPAARDSARPSVRVGPSAVQGIAKGRPSTVVRGTSIPAILETGIDTSTPGFARAIVTRDVRGTGGQRIVIPRGSHLIGKYQGAATDAEQSQINWTRLIRPDGVSLTLGSLAGDPVGRTALKAKSKERLLDGNGDAILLTLLNLSAVAVSGSGVSNPILLERPGSQRTQDATKKSRAVARTILNPGTTISVLVALDLDFAKL